MYELQRGRRKEKYMFTILFVRAAERLTIALKFQFSDDVRPTWKKKSKAIEPMKGCQNV